MAKANKPNQLSEPITAKEVIANEPEVKETLYVPEITEIPLLQEEKVEALVNAYGNELLPVTVSELKAPEPQTEEEKLLQFLQGKTGYVRINELLKSLYGVPKFTEPAKWLQQGENKRLRGLLQRLINEGKLTVKDSRHTQLGKFYYNESDVQQHYNIHNTVIEAAPKTT